MQHYSYTYWTQTIYKWQESEFVFSIFGENTKPWTWGNPSTNTRLIWSTKWHPTCYSNSPYDGQGQYNMGKILGMQPRRVCGAKYSDFLLRSEKGSVRQCVMMHWFSLRMEKDSLLCHDVLVFCLELKKVRQCVMHWFSLKIWKRFGSPMCHDALIFFKNGKRFTTVSWCTGVLFRTEKGSPMCHALIFS